MVRAGTDPIRVAVVDDDAVSRAGIVALLRGAQMEVVLDCSHEGSVAALAEVLLDVLVADAADDRQAADHFPGVGVVAALRAMPQHRNVTIIVVSGHRLDGGLSLRMREVGADLMLDRREVRDDGVLIGMVRDPTSARRGVEVVDRETMEQLGITPSSTLQALVEEVERSGFATIFEEGGVPDGAPPRRSRQWSHMRERVARAGGIQARNTDGRAPHRDQEVPSLGQLRRVYTYARRVKDRRPTA